MFRTRFFSISPNIFERRIAMWPGKRLAALSYLSCGCSSWNRVTVNSMLIYADW
ncbi:unnamed protein product [Echinostoma caproni]|uniref:Uncharacterized protein n=1 Tax=Echinostoma caproni TaxID=27848 RepID=A0A183BB84_9TREM|nr:unnamed protein product [Echinostoma caproni]